MALATGLAMSLLALGLGADAAAAPADSASTAAETDNKAKEPSKQKKPVPIPNAAKSDPRSPTPSKDGANSKAGNKTQPAKATIGVAPKPTLAPTASPAPAATGLKI